MGLKLYKTDLKKIGHTAYGREWWPINHDETEYLSIICEVRTANIEEILLRNILELFGDYEIVKTFDVDGADGECFDVEFVTNLPWEEYLKLDNYATDND